MNWEKEFLNIGLTSSIHSRKIVTVRGITISNQNETMCNGYAVTYRDDLTAFHQLLPKHLLDGIRCGTRAIRAKFC